MNKSALHKFCNQKLAAKRKKGARHDHYIPMLDGTPVELLCKLSVSRGKGAVDLRNIKSIAVSLGMSINDLQHAANCKIGPAAAYLGMAVQILQKARIAVELTPRPHYWDHNYLGLIDPILTLSKRRKNKKKGKEDAAFLKKINNTTLRLRENSRDEVENEAVKILEAIQEQFAEMS